MDRLKEMEGEKKTCVEEKRAKERVHVEKLVCGLSTKECAVFHVKCYFVCVCLCRTIASSMPGEGLKYKVKKEHYRRRLMR